MSFKREGDDYDLLQNLKHRRVSELLANYVPEDEAKLLSNGRLTCLVCSHRPIFDTVSMLSLHRKGKKHISELSKYLARKRELELRRLKAEHGSYLGTGSVPARPEPPAPAQSRLLASRTPYSSCCRPQRRPALDVSCLPGQSDMTLKKVDTISLPSANSQVRRYLKDLWRKRPLEKEVKRRRENFGGTTDCDTGPTSEVNPAITIEAKADTRKSNPEAEKEAAYSLQLKMSGWIKDSNGRWIKDPEVEFDSDEYEPPPPPS
ncbi:sodium channel modifier 1-like isoform X2 [Bacillus rossius redtenbacheri]|uniref:sodium channel modifier 1-like isoform X2 n=1 Tax=Bacillus rossius redtenbacheri TaxID=93214 RepID=UPI002FDCECE5